MKENLGVDLAASIFSILMNQSRDFEKINSLKTFDLLLGLVKEGIENKSFRDDLSPEELALLILKIERGLVYNWCLCKGSYSLIEQSKKEFSLILKMLKA